MGSTLMLCALLLVLATAGCVKMAAELPDQYREPFAKSWPIREKQHIQMKDYLDAFPPREREVERVARAIREELVPCSHASEDHLARWDVADLARGAEPGLNWWNRIAGA